MEVEETTTRISGKRFENKRKTDLPDSPHESHPSSTDETPTKKTQFEDTDSLRVVKKKAVVVLTRLPEYKISALRPPTPQQFYSEDESFSSSDSDMQWEAEGDSSDSDFSASNNKQNTGKPTKSGTSRTPPPQTSNNNNNDSSTTDHLHKNHVKQYRGSLQTRDTKVPLCAPNKPQTQTLWEALATAHGRSMWQRITKIEAAVIISSAFAHCSNEIAKVRPNLPDEEVKVDMTILARKKHMRWQRGKIVEIVTREDGRLKYKVSFKEKGKSLVSGHHIAFDTTPGLEQLYVGARVVVKCRDDKFQPAILAELPSRKNRSRFLVFLDDHVPVYVGLPLLHLVCRPLEDVSEDIPDGPHKYFMGRYLKDWPCPHLTHYTAGQTLNVEFNGVQQRCEVQVVDSSLIQVVFQNNQHKEWIHRGSIRLEHMTRFLELQAVEVREDDSD